MLHMTEKQVEKAAFAGGCFWCMVKPFKEWDGIHDVVSGYMGGHVENPTYEDVKKGDSGHLEVVEITYDPSYFPLRKATRSVLATNRSNGCGWTIPRPWPFLLNSHFLLYRRATGNR